MDWDSVGSWLLGQFTLLALLRNVVVLVVLIWVAAGLRALYRSALAWDGWPGRDRVSKTIAPILQPILGWPLKTLFGRDPFDDPPADGVPSPALEPRHSPLRRAWGAARGAYASLGDEAISKWLLRLFAAFAGIVGLWVFVLLAPEVLRDFSTDLSRDEVLTHRIGLATIVALVGLPLLFIRSWINERQTRVAEKQSQLAEAGHVTERIIKATELLGQTREAKHAEGTTVTVPNIEVRLGAIYTLERVARESKEDFPHIFDAFSSYIRGNFETKCDPGSVLTEFPKTLRGEPWDVSECIRPGEDVSATIKAMIRLSSKGNGLGYALRRSVWEEVPLCGGDFRELFYAYNFLNPKIDLSGARLECCNLWRAGFSGGKFERTNFNHSYLRKAFFNDANLSVAQFQSADLTDAVFWGSDLSGAQFGGANLIGAYFFQERVKAPTGLQQYSIEHAFGDKHTAEQIEQLGLKAPEHWSKVRIMDPIAAENAWIEWKSDVA